MATPVVGPFTRLPRPPATDDKRQWSMWYDKVHMILSGQPGIEWNVVDKHNSHLSDIETRPHSALTDVLQSDDTSTSTTAEKHVTDTQVKVYGDHVRIIDGNPHGTDHAMLDAVLQADDTSTSTTVGKHVTDAQLKYYKDRVHDKMTAQPDSTASTLGLLVADFNTLLAKLRASGRLTP